MKKKTEKYEFVCKVCGERFVYDRIVRSRPREYCFTCFMMTYKNCPKSVAFKCHSGETCVSIKPPKLTKYAIDLLDRIAARKTAENRREREIREILDFDSNVEEIHTSTSTMDVVTRGRCCGGCCGKNKKKEY